MKSLQKNPLLEASPLSFHAFPFDQLQTAHFQPALDEALAEAHSNLAKLKAQNAPATFDNTILALETANEKLHQVAAIFFNLLGTSTNDEMQALAQKLSPQIAAFSSDVLLDSQLFARVQAVYNQRDTLNLNGEQKRLIEKTFKGFSRNGALLNDADKKRLRDLDQEMASLGPQFSDNVLKATLAFQLVITDPADLAGLPEAVVEAAAMKAQEKGLQQSWVFSLQAPSYVPFMMYADTRALREKMYRAYTCRAFRDAFDNSSLCQRITQLRHQRAQLLGYSTHAHFVLEERMAEKPEVVMRFLNRLVEKSRPAAERDVAAVRALQKELTGQDDLMPWDYAYFSEKLKKRIFDLDEELLRPYFQLENVVAGVFEHARKLYGLEFRRNKQLPVYHPEVEVYEVHDIRNNRYIGLFYADFFPRASKRDGGWMSSFRDQGLFFGEVGRPHVAIVCNFTKPTPSKPSLLGLQEVRTLFHEFGHALHGLLSDCTYTSLAGTSVYWDFVELPSQIMENWLREKESLDLFARHYETQEKLPLELAEKIKSSARFQAGYQSLRQLNFALLDMSWHAQDPAGIQDVEEFEKKVTAATVLLPRIPGSNVSTSFSHIFAGGYSAGYYSYKWAEVLDADAFELFQEKGLFNDEVAKRFRACILSQGSKEHPMELYKKFRGREPDPDALLRRDGLI